MGIHPDRLAAGLPARIQAGRPAAKLAAGGGRGTHIRIKAILCRNWRKQKTVSKFVGDEVTSRLGQHSLRRPLPPNQDIAKQSR